MLFHYQVREYYLYCLPTDMRRGIDSLSGLVRVEFKKNPLLGDLFIFINRRRNQIKMLHWQRDGFGIFYKRLEKGTYEIPALSSSFNHAAITSEELLFILQGVVLASVKKKQRYTQMIVENVL